jgi:HSP20 family protein
LELGAACDFDRGILSRLGKRSLRNSEGKCTRFRSFIHHTPVQALDPPIEDSESPRTLIVRADVPGFKEKDLEIEVEPRRVTIAGKWVTRSGSHTHKRIYSEVSSDVILRVIDLPATVDAAKVKTTVKDGVLELDLSKADPEPN